MREEKVLTVGELIAELQKFDENLLVYYDGDFKYCKAGIARRVGIGVWDRITDEEKIVEAVCIDSEWEDEK